MTKICFQIESYRCTSTSQDQILLSFIKQADPKATASLRWFTRGRNWSFDMSVYGNCIQSPHIRVFIYKSDNRYCNSTEAGVRFGGFGLVGGFFGFFSSLEIIQGQHMENRTEITKRKDCSWEKQYSQQSYAWLRKWTTDPCSGKILSMNSFLVLQSTLLQKGGGRQHRLWYLLYYFSTLHKRFKIPLSKCWPLVCKNLSRRNTEQGWVSTKQFHLLKPVVQAASV